MSASAPVRIELRPSRLAGRFILVTHLATAALVAWLPLDAGWRALAVLCVGAHAMRANRDSSLRRLPSSIVAVELAADRRVALTRRDSGRITGEAKAESYVGEWVTTLVFRPDASRWNRALWLLPDMATAEELRRFRVLLRLGRAEAG